MYLCNRIEKQQFRTYRGTGQTTLIFMNLQFANLFTNIPALAQFCKNPSFGIEAKDKHFISGEISGTDTERIAKYIQSHVHICYKFDAKTYDWRTINGYLNTVYGFRINPDVMKEIVISRLYVVHDSPGLAVLLLDEDWTLTD